MPSSSKKTKGANVYGTLGTSDFDAQLSGIKYWKGDENLRPVYKNGFTLLAFWTF
jgi:hypothetical protein